MQLLKLYGPDFSYFVRVCRLMLQYKGISYELTLSPKGEFIQPFSKEHEAIHPFKKLPCLIDGDHIIPESLAIGVYLDGLSGPSLLPDLGKAQCLALANMIQSYVHSSVMKNVVLEVAFPKGAGGEIRWQEIEKNKADAREKLAWLNQRLDSEYFAFGERFSLVDCYLIPMLDYFAYLPEQLNLIKGLDKLQTYIDWHRTQAWSEGVLGKPNIPLRK